MGGSRGIVNVVSALVGLAVVSSSYGQVMIEARPVRVDADRGPMPVRDVWTPPFIEDTFDLGAVPAVVFEELNLKPIVAEDQISDGLEGVPMRIGVNRALPTGPLGSGDAGLWHRADDGSNTWSLIIEAPGAKMLRVHFSVFALPEGAFVLVRGDDALAVDMYEHAGPNGNGTFWSIPVEGEFVEIQYQAPAGVDEAPSIEVDEVSHVYRTKPLMVAAAGNIAERVDLNCHEDVMCHTVDTTARDSVGLMIWTQGGTFICTGGLLNDADPNTFAGYFLTANHCLSTQSAIDSLVVYWFYQKLSCNGVTPALSSRPKSFGGTLLWTSAGNDATFLRLADDPDSGQGFAAWSTAPVGPGATVYGIHHPNGEYRRYSEGDITLNQPRCLGANFWYLDWYVGATEGGSSGSPLFNSNWEVIGQLFGSCGSANCTNQASTNVTYGKFDYTHNFVQSWLDSVATDDVHEDNDSFAEASPIDSGAHGLYLVDFDDYFSFTLGCEREVTFTATFLTADMDLDLELLNASQSVVDSSTTNTGTETVSALLPAGDYVVRATKDSGWGGAYTLAVDLGSPCFDDCNSNGIDDLVDISGGASEDCNSNNIPDECDIVAGAFAHNSGVLSPIGYLENQTVDIVSPPAADGDVTLSFEASGDFGDAGESITVVVGGSVVGVILINGSDCATIPDAEQLTMTAAEWDTAISNGGGDVSILLFPTTSVGTLECASTWITVATDYPVGAYSEDGDNNGIPDECGAPVCEADVTTAGAGAGDPGYGVPDGQVTGADINYYVNAWVIGDASIADVTTAGAGAGDPGYGVPDGQVTGADINYYVNAWVAGCP